MSRTPRCPGHLHHPHLRGPSLTSDTVIHEILYPWGPKCHPPPSQVTQASWVSRTLKYLGHPHPRAPRCPGHIQPRALRCPRGPRHSRYLHLRGPQCPSAPSAQAPGWNGSHHRSCFAHGATGPPGWLRQHHGSAAALGARRPLPPRWLQDPRPARTVPDLLPRDSAHGQGHQCLRAPKTTTPWGEGTQEPPTNV